MKYRLKTKLIELGYSEAYIEDKLKEWKDYLKEGKAWEGEEDDIIVEKWQQPTEEIPKFFLNVNKIFDKILLFDGEIYSIYKENIFNDNIQFADYQVCDKICLLRIAKE